MNRVLIFRWILGIILLNDSVASAIINGLEVDHADSDISRTLVALQTSEKQTDGGIRYYKGTSFLIGPDLLLTAAHNVAYAASVDKVEAIFATKPCWGGRNCGQKRIKASKIKVHPLFHQTEGGTMYDLALIKLNENPPDGYQSIRLISQKAEIGGNSKSVFGFGTDQESSDAPLSAFRLRSTKLSALNEKYQLGSEQKFWFDQRSGGVCGGDSGGPAINESYEAIGIAIHVTYHNGKANCLTKSAFTDIFFFKEWIDEAIEEFQSTKLESINYDL